MSSCTKSLASSSLLRCLSNSRPSLSAPSITFCAANNGAQTWGVRVPCRSKANAAKEKSSKKGPILKIESMPFQAYQLALQIIREDRQEKLVLIRKEKERIAHALAQPGTTKRSRHVVSMLIYLERLKILADINSPRIKYNFDNGIISMNRPIYRYLADKKWREMKRPLLMQRILQMNVVPDVLPYLEPVVDVQVRFRGRDVKPGKVVNSLRSEQQPTVKILPFQPGDMLCTIAVVDPDVPDPARDTYRYRLHWLVSNIPISATETQALGAGAKKSNIIVPWLPPHCQKGILYHRYALLVFRQSGTINAEALAPKINRDTFNMRSFQATQHLDPIGAYMFRSKWDSNTAEVMKRHNLSGWDKMWRKLRPRETRI